MDVSTDLFRLLATLVTNERGIESQNGQHQKGNGLSPNQTIGAKLLKKYQLNKQREQSEKTSKIGARMHTGHRFAFME